MTKKLLITLLLVIAAVTTSAQTMPVSQMEKLTRGVVALPSETGGNFVSWRLLGTDPLTTTFDLLRDGQTIARNLGNRTNFTDTQGTSTNQYQVIVRVDGKETERTETISPWDECYQNVKLQRPAGGVYPYKTDNAFVPTPYSYFPKRAAVHRRSRAGDMISGAKALPRRNSR